MVSSFRPAVLYLVHRVPYPPDKGDRIRNFHLLRFLARHASIHLACLADEPIADDVTAALRTYCERLTIVPLDRRRWWRAAAGIARGRTVSEGAFSSPGLSQVVRAWGRETRFHAALVSASSMVSYLRLQELRDVPAVIDLVDVDSQKWLDYAAKTAGPRSWLYRLEGRRLRALEQQLPSAAQAVTLVGDAEAELYRRFCAPGDVRAITNGVDLDYFAPSAVSTERSCVFLGALDYLPNVDGINWFCRNVWPAIVLRRPDARIYLVGRRPATAVRRLTELPGIELVGQVPDVRPHMARAGVAVVPLRIARGVQNKVLEGLAMGKPTVASPPALTGLHVDPGTHLLSASAANDWIEAILRLWDDQALRRRLSTAGRAYVEEHHRWETCLHPFLEVLALAPGPLDSGHSCVRGAAACSHA
jgi:sugar transferase (PEP-CTERM/EpsH1 system associated)